MRIAVVDRTSSKWSAGGSFTEMVVRSLRGAGGKELDIIVLGSPSSRFDGLARVVTVPALKPAGKWSLQKTLGKKEFTPEEAYCEREGVGALFLATEFSQAATKVRRIAWIYDFQHKYLPELFTENELKSRDRVFEMWARSADAVILSSGAVLKDFKIFLSDFASKGVVASFPSLYAFLPPSGEPSIEAAKYGLPEKFVLVANQYWKHKNHSVVIRAIETLNGRGVKVPVVFTGLPLDGRDLGNASVSTMLQEIALSGTAGQVVPLGLIPKSDLTDLMRLAAVVIQPSRFEGWSTVVQDAAALGRPLICSDIAVHREQGAHSDATLGYFGCDEQDRLADILEEHWPGLESGPDINTESRALDKQREIAAEHGRILLGLSAGGL